MPLRRRCEMKLGTQGVGQVALRAVVTLFVLSGGFLNSEANGATYYLSPSGSNSNPGTSSGSPWQTFAFAIPRLQPGDTLVLRDGTYNRSNSGFPNILCGTGATNGTASQPITVKA